VRSLRDAQLGERQEKGLQPTKLHFSLSVPKLAETKGKSPVISENIKETSSPIQTLSHFMKAALSFRLNLAPEIYSPHNETYFLIYFSYDTHQKPTNFIERGQVEWLKWQNTCLASVDALSSNPNTVGGGFHCMYLDLMY
jgi:hypothetical protein